MKELKLVAALMGGLVVVPVQAATCPGATQLDPALLAGYTVCTADGAGGWQEQEYHASDGKLWDYKRGTGDKVDPTRDMGSWTVNVRQPASKQTVTYRYTDKPGGAVKWTTPEYELYSNGSQAYSLCGSTGSRDVTLRSGQTSCSASQAVDLPGAAVNATIKSLPPGQAKKYQ
jgi:hypothetical protein